MPKRLVLGLALILALPHLSSAQEKKTIRLAEVFGIDGRLSYRSAIPDVARWAEDGKHLVWKGRWFDPATLKEVEKPTEKPEPTEHPGAFFEALKTAGLKLPKAGRPVRSTVPRHAEANPGVLSSGGVRVILVENDLWSWKSGRGLLRLTKDGKPKRRIQLAPGGGAVSFVLGFDLVIVDTETGANHACSDDGSENLFYGELDWVYQEEVYGRFDFNATWWSPKGKHLAYLRIDEEGVPTFTVVDHIPTHLGIEHLKYPKTGDINPRATLFVASAAKGKPVAVDLSAYEGQEILIVRVGWTPKGELLFQIQDREQTWLDLVRADPSSGKTTRLIHETSKTWVNVLGEPHWLSDGGFLWESERTGMRHLYHYGPDDKLVGAVTQGDWQLRSLLDVDEKRGSIVFEGTKDGAIQRNVYTCGLDGKGLTRLTSGRGSHSVSFSADGAFFLDRFTSLDNPGEQRLAARDGRVLAILGRAPLPAAAKSHGLSLPELVSVPCRDGYAMDGTILKPHDFDPAKAWPVWFETYSGPDAPTVADRWNASGWHQFLAQRGYIVFQVNVRSASGRGQSHTAACYQQLGMQECHDIEDALSWLGAHSWVDAERIGMTGWSFGGFITAFTMMKTKLLRLGIAGGGVYTWRDYDTIYTERYMRTPQNNPEGYAKTSTLAAAPDLHGHLVIVHGSMDDNVHLQNAIQLVYALQQANRSFDLMLYPRTRHGIRSRAQFWHFRQLIWDKMQAHLPPGPKLEKGKAENKGN